MPWSRSPIEPAGRSFGDTATPGQCKRREIDRPLRKPTGPRTPSSFGSYRGSVLSEESEEREVRGRRDWPRLWIVDSLDGMKEFLKGTGEFTVNEDGLRPIRSRTFPGDSPVLVASRDHSGPGVGALAEALGPAGRFTGMGSSLKFCFVAEGHADLYLRDLPMMEWDTAAAQSVLEHAGGAVYGLSRDGAGALAGRFDGTRLRYNKDSLENPPFLAVGDPTGAWRERIAEDPKA